MSFSFKFLSFFIFSIILSFFTLPSQLHSKQHFIKNPKSVFDKLKKQKKVTVKRKFNRQPINNFSRCLHIKVKNNLKSKEINLAKDKKDRCLIWHKVSPIPFSELITSWNSFNPKKGYYSVFVNIKTNNKWSEWDRLAEWGKKWQKTYCNTRKPIIHTKHVRIELQKKVLGSEFKIKIVARNGADIKNIKAIFANVSNWQKFIEQRPAKFLQNTCITDVPKVSQWWLAHHRRKDLCSPTSISMITEYFCTKKNIAHKSELKKEAVRFADSIRDHSLNIFGNWLFGVLRAFPQTNGKVFYKVERLNNFESLHKHLVNKIPVAVSIRGSLRGGAWPYKNGHFVVIIGWDNKKRSVICIDPAFRVKKDIVRYYKIEDFVKAWGKSKNLSYVPTFL